MVKNGGTATPPEEGSRALRCSESARMLDKLESFDEVSMRFQGRVCQAKTARQMCPSQSRPRAARTHTHARMRAHTHTHTHRSHLLQTYLCACRSGLLGPDASCDMTCVECLHCSVFQSRGLPLPSIDNTRRECVSTCVNQTCFHFHCNHLGVSSPV